MQIRSLRVSVIVFLSLLWGKNCADLFIGHYFWAENCLISRKTNSWKSLRDITTESIVMLQFWNKLTFVVQLKSLKWSHSQHFLLGGFLVHKFHRGTQFILQDLKMLNSVVQLHIALKPLFFRILPRSYQWGCNLIISLTRSVSHHCKLYARPLCVFTLLFLAGLWEHLWAPSAVSMRYFGSRFVCAILIIFSSFLPSFLYSYIISVIRPEMTMWSTGRLKSRYW